jgi:hypothetical protein
MLKKKGPGQGEPQQALVLLDGSTERSTTLQPAHDVPFTPTSPYLNWWFKTVIPS